MALSALSGLSGLSGIVGRPPAGATCGDAIPLRLTRTYSVNLGAGGIGWYKVGSVRFDGTVNLEWTYASGVEVSTEIFIGPTCGSQTSITTPSSDSNWDEDVSVDHGERVWVRFEADTSLVGTLVATFTRRVNQPMTRIPSFTRQLG